MIGSSILLDPSWIRQLGRAVDLLHHSVRGRHPVENAGRGRDEVHAELALETLLDDLHVEQPEEAAPKAEAERRRGLRLEEERRVVQPQLLQRVAQLRILAAFDRVQTGEDHRFADLEAGERFRRGARRLGDRVPDLRVRDGLDSGEDESNLADAKLLDHRRLGREHADLIDDVLLPLRHQPDLHARTDDAVDQAGQDDHAAIRVVPGVEDQGLERRVGIALRRRQARHDRLEHVVHADAFLGARQDRVTRVEPDDLLDLPFRLVWLRAWKIDLVDDRDDLQVVLDGEIGVGKRLRLDALRCIHEE